MDKNIWAKAASQILFSLSVAFGSQLVLSSYNNFSNNAHRDSIIVGICNSLTSLYAGIVVFLILGFLADNTGSTIDDVVKAGITLAFVSYPSAVLEMAGSQFWSFLFFFMLINLALSSICGGVQTFLAFIIDEKPSLAKHRTWIVMGLSVLFFLAGLPMCTNGGIMLFTVFDKRCTSSLLFICLLEIVHVAWFYGTENFFDNLSEMSMDFNKPLKWIWKALWIAITPLILIFIIVLSWINHERMEYDGYKFPDSVEAVGWIMELLPLVIALLYPVIPLYKAWREGFKGMDLFRELFNPTEKWYTAQMDRRQEEVRIREESKYYHHNLGYDYDENMQAPADLKIKPPSYEAIKKADLEEIESLPEAQVMEMTEIQPPKFENDRKSPENETKIPEIEINEAQNETKLDAEEDSAVKSIENAIRDEQENTDEKL